MSYNVEITYTAEKDIFEIYRYISEEIQEVDTAKGQVDRLEKSIQSLEHLPERYPIIDIHELAHLNIRKLPIDNYIIFYKILNNTVYVVRVLYAKRQWVNLL